jgi:hypothetical protein
MNRCTLTVFGKPLANMTKPNADSMRGHLAITPASCRCNDCLEFWNRWAATRIDIEADRIARDRGMEEPLAEWERELLSEAFGV